MFRRRKWYDFPRKSKWFSQRYTAENVAKFHKDLVTIASADYVLDDHGFHGILLSFKELSPGCHPFLRCEDVPEILYRTEVDKLSELPGKKVEVYHTGICGRCVSLSVPNDSVEG